MTKKTEWIEEKSKAPSFQLSDQSGAQVKLENYAGSPVVLYFYPKNFTPGCTQEACAFRDRSGEIADLGAVILGVSPDSAESHAKFADKYELGFTLLADEDHKVAESYGAWREKNMYGKKSMGIQRSTFLIDAQGKVAKVWKRVKVAEHDTRVGEALKALP